MFPFRRLEVWQLAHQATLRAYELTRSFPSEERYGLAAQLRRAAVSIATNIAEGSKRVSAKDYAHFVNIAEGSAAEACYLVDLARDLRLMPEKDALALAREFDAIVGKLYKLRRRLTRDSGHAN